MPKTFQQIREQVALIGKAFEQYDGTTDQIVDRRFRAEVLDVDPDLLGGQLTKPDVAKQIHQLDAVRPTAEQVILRFTGGDTLDEARQIYLGLLTLVQRVMRLEEIERLTTVVPSFARKELESDYGPGADLDKLPYYLQEARYTLDVYASRLPTPGITDVPETTPTGRIILR